MKELNAKEVILPYALILLGLSVASHIVIALTDNRIGAVAQATVVVMALYYAYYHLKNNRKLAQIRFGKLVAHATGYLIVNLGFFVHALVLFVTGSNAIEGKADSPLPIDPGWFGVLFGMASFWGIGLLIHSIASIAQRGYEDLDG